VRGSAASKRARSIGPARTQRDCKGREPEAVISARASMVVPLSSALSDTRALSSVPSSAALTAAGKPLVREAEAGAGRNRGPGAERHAIDVHRAQAILRRAALHLDDIDIGRRDLHAERERRRGLARRRILRELDLQRRGAHRRERDPAAERGEKIDPTASLAQLDAQAVALVGEAAKMHLAGEHAARILDCQRAAARGGRAREGPAQPILGAEAAMRPPRSHPAVRRAEAEREEGKARFIVRS
jgi:hypothetical protein